MAEHVNISGGRPLPSPPELIDLNNHPDGELLALSQEFQGREPQFKAWLDEVDHLRPSHPRAKEIQKLERALVKRGFAIRERVFKLPARTPEGLEAKARMVLIDLEDEADPTKPYVNHQYLAAVSLARDLLERAT